MTPRQNLIAARALIAKPAAWTQGLFAADRKGRKVAVDSSNATCWCMIGAIDTEKPQS